MTTVFALIRSTAALTVLSAVLATSASANNSRCGQRDKLVEHLAQKYREQPTSMGLQSDGHVLEVFSSRDSGTWTILVSRPDGISCIAIAGEGWQATRAAGAAAVNGPGA